jgi:small subunit ribosomal protein S18
MPRKTRPDERKGGRTRSASEMRTPRPKPKIDFTVDALDFKNINLLKQFVTDQGRILPRKYTGLPAHYQRRLNRAIKRARQMLLMR